ncbi:MAG: class I SAM-dependent methyltransferase, partial [Actinomycetota bacterium]
MSVDPDTAAIYREKASAWRDARVGKPAGPAARLAEAIGQGPVGPILDVGCGPGLLAAHLPGHVIALDPIREMLDLLPDHAPEASPVLAAADPLPFA